MKINILWFRRDLRLDDNTGLINALNSGLPVLPVFIYDTNIINELSADDPRISFIYESLLSINRELKKCGSSVYILKGNPEKIWHDILLTFDINAVYINKDYEPYAIKRDIAVEVLLRKKQIPILKFKDQVIFEEKEITKSDNNPYTIFTPYKNSWLEKFSEKLSVPGGTASNSALNYYPCNFEFPTLEKIGFCKS